MCDIERTDVWRWNIAGPRESSIHKGGTTEDMWMDEGMYEPDLEEEE